MLRARRQSCFLPLLSCPTLRLAASLSPLPQGQQTQKRKQNTKETDGLKTASSALPLVPQLKEKLQGTHAHAHAHTRKGSEWGLSGRGKVRLGGTHEDAQEDDGACHARAACPLLLGLSRTPFSCGPLSTRRLLSLANNPYPTLGFTHQSTIIHSCNPHSLSCSCGWACRACWTLQQQGGGTSKQTVSTRAVAPLLRATLAPGPPAESCRPCPSALSSSTHSTAQSIQCQFIHALSLLCARDSLSPPLALFPNLGSANDGERRISKKKARGHGKETETRRHERAFPSFS